MNLPLARHSVFRYVGAKSKAPALHKPGGLFLTGFRRSGFVIRNSVIFGFVIRE